MLTSKSITIMLPLPQHHPFFPHKASWVGFSSLTKGVRMIHALNWDTKEMSSSASIRLKKFREFTKVSGTEFHHYKINRLN